MEETMVRKRKWFWPWQDEAEEAWLEEMSKRGYHLSSAGLLGSYTFSVAEPRDYVYRLDYQMLPKKDGQEYLQLFRDAGWEHIGATTAWQYFRKEATQGETNEIYTDVESKVAKYRRVLAYLAFFVVIWVAAFAPTIRNVWSDSPYSWWGVVRVISLLGTPVMLLLIYVIGRLALRIRQLRRS